MVNCEFCLETPGVSIPATHSVPTECDNGWQWESACTFHASTWWDGSDYPNGEGAPAIRAIQP